MSAPRRLTPDEAADLARVTRDEIQDALESGELRALTLRDVEAWRRARIAPVIRGWQS